MNDGTSPPVEVSGHMLSAKFLHDLRTPLNQIIGYSEMLTEQAQEEGQAGFVPDLQKIQNAGRQLLQLFSNTIPSLPEAVFHENEPDSAKHCETVAEEDTAAEPQSASVAAGPSAAAVFPALILVVDDNAMNRDVLSRPLLRQGYGVVTAENGREAMEAVRAQAFDLVLLDIMMPEMDGYEVLRQLKADETLRHLPVIMISALDEMESVVRCIGMGAEDYLPKPFDPTLLKARIYASLERKKGHDREVHLFKQLQEQYNRERHIAKSLQRPLTLEIAEDAFPGLSIATLFEAPSASEAEVGGDFFDAFALPSERVLLAVADASGKGLAAAARTMQVKDVLRAFAREYPHVPGHIASRLNDYVCDIKRFEQNTDAYETFVCLGLVIVHPETGEAAVLAAGAESPLILRASGEYETVPVSGMPLGVSPHELYTTSVVHLGPGDTLILLTDGITEARRGKEFLGQEGLIELARQGRASATTLREMGLFIMDGARAFAGGTLRDDACLLLAQRKIT